MTLVHTSDRRPHRHVIVDLETTLGIRWTDTVSTVNRLVATMMADYVCIFCIRHAALHDLLVRKPP